MDGRRARLASLLITMSLAATTAACSGNSDSDDPLASYSPAETAASAPVAAQTSQSAGPSSTRPPTAPVPTHAPAEQPLAAATQEPPPAPQDIAPCKTANLSVRVVRQGGKKSLGLIALTNTTSRACGLSGWPSVALTTGEQALSLSSTNVNRPRPPVAITVEPQRSAFAGVRWRACTPPAAGCRTGDGFRVSVPGSAAVQAELVGFGLTQQKGFTISALVIGTLQPTTTDIINW